jgi:hypothetical protein
LGGRLGTCVEALLVRHGQKSEQLPDQPEGLALRLRFTSQPMLGGPPHIFLVLGTSHEFKRRILSEVGHASSLLRKRHCLHASGNSIAPDQLFHSTDTVKSLDVRELVQTAARGLLSGASSTTDLSPRFNRSNNLARTLW